MGMVNGRSWKYWRLSSNGFWENIGCLISAPTFFLGGYRLWDKEGTKRVIGKKTNNSFVGRYFSGDGDGDVVCNWPLPFRRG